MRYTAILHFPKSYAASAKAGASVLAKNAVGGGYHERQYAFFALGISRFRDRQNDGAGNRVWLAQCMGVHHHVLYGYGVRHLLQPFRHSRGRALVSVFRLHHRLLPDGVRCCRVRSAVRQGIPFEKGYGSRRSCDECRHAFGACFASRAAAFPCARVLLGGCHGAWVGDVDAVLGNRVRSREGAGRPHQRADGSGSWVRSEHAGAAVHSGAIRRVGIGGHSDGRILHSALDRPRRWRRCTHRVQRASDEQNEAGG